MAMTVQDAAAKDVFGASQTRQNGRSGRSTNYTEAEDVALLKAWEGVRLDAVTTGNDQARKRYWQRVKDRFHRLTPEPSARSLRSLQGRYDFIKHSCSRWSGCLEQARSARPIGCSIDDDAQERYRQMAASKGKAFVLQHCWKLLEHSEKWNGEKCKFVDHEGPPLKKRISNSPTTHLDDHNDEDEDDDGHDDNVDDDDGGDDDEDDDGAGGGGGTMFPLSSSSMMMITEFMKASHKMAAQAFRMKEELAEKKHQHKMAMWQQIKEIEEKKMALEERRLLLEEKKVALKERRFLLEEKKMMRQEIIAEENKLMMMDPNGMDEKTRADWEIKRGKIL